MDRLGQFFAFCHGGREGLVSQKKIRHVWGTFAAFDGCGKIIKSPMARIY